MPYCFQKKTNSGYTLAELVVVIAVISTLSTAVVVNYNHYKGTAESVLAAQKVASDIREVAGWAISLKEFGGAINSNGWGLFFAPNNNKYAIYADSDGNSLCQSTCNNMSTERYSEIDFINNADITDIDVGFGNPTRASILFVPPNPDIIICTNVSCGYDWVELEVDGGNNTILINRYGLVDVN